MMDSKGLIARLRELKEFLDGSSAINNMWFGQSYGIGAYWWRAQHLSVMEESATHIAAQDARIEALEGALEKAEGNASSYQTEVESLVRAIAARKQGRRDVPSLYEWTARNWPTDWQLSGGNNEAASGGKDAG